MSLFLRDLKPFHSRILLIASSSHRIIEAFSNMALCNWPSWSPHRIIEALLVEFIIIPEWRLPELLYYIPNSNHCWGTVLCYRVLPTRVRRIYIQQCIWSGGLSGKTRQHVARLWGNKFSYLVFLSCWSSRNDREIPHLALPSPQHQEPEEVVECASDDARPAPTRSIFAGEPPARPRRARTSPVNHRPGTPNLRRWLTFLAPLHATEAALDHDFLAADLDRDGRISG
jgi:hypothetical protein